MQIVNTQFQVVYTILSCAMWFFCVYQVYQLAWYCCVTVHGQRRALRGALADVISEALPSGQRLVVVKDASSLSRELNQLNDQEAHHDQKAHRDRQTLQTP